MRILLIVSISLIVLVPLALYSCGRLENPVRELSDYDESLHDGNWVPRYFPDDITEIQEQHAIDASQVWLRFTVGKQTYSPEAHGYAKVVDRTSLAHSLRKPFSTGWWFDNDILNDQGGSTIYAGPCDPESRMKEEMRGFVLIHGTTVYWWCQYM